MTVRNPRLKDSGMDSDILKIFLEYVWIPIVTAVGLVWTKMVRIGLRTRLLEQAADYYRIQRTEDRKLRDEQRKEILEHINVHHTTIMSKLDSLEARVKNGH